MFNKMNLSLNYGKKCTVKIENSVHQLVVIMSFSVPLMSCHQLAA
jgi:hypothetical protein